MTFSDKTEYIRYRLDASYTTFDAARVLADNGFWNSAVNRLYYSVFYAVSALLVVHDIHTKTHSAVKGQFSLHFVKTGVFDKKYGQLLSELFDWRQKGDYENIFEYDQESVEPLFIPVKEMLDLIKAEIQKSIEI